MTERLNIYNPHQPTVRQLLHSETMSEAQVLFGEDLLDRAVTQVISTLNPLPRAGSALVLRFDQASIRDAAAIKDLAALIIIRSVGADSPPALQAVPAAGTEALAPQFQPATFLQYDVLLKGLSKVCEEASVPLIVVPAFGDPAPIADEIRLAFLKELRHLSATLHASLMTELLENGLEGLVETVSQNLNRPVAVETTTQTHPTPQNMGATPAAQQHAVTEQASELIKQMQRARAKGGEYKLSPFKNGRRLILPIVLSDVIVAYFSVMVRAGDDADSVAEYMQPAGLAVMVDFNQRRKEGSVFVATQKSLLKDILSGRSLSASDQERLERTYGFDLCDGLLVFAVAATAFKQAPGTAASGAKPVSWSDESFITTEVEGTRVFVMPLQSKDKGKEGEQPQLILQRLKKSQETEGYEVKIKMGVSRRAETVLDLPEAYREARQALVIGGMIHGDQEFVTKYGDLGVKRLLYLMIDHTELDRFYEENLEPLEVYDAEWESELVPTLRVYLEHGANLNSTARALFIHRHTLRYRLEQIADILKCDIDSQEVLLNLQIAFLIGDMKGLARRKGN